MTSLHSDRNNQTSLGGPFVFSLVKEGNEEGSKGGSKERRINKIKINK